MTEGRGRRATCLWRSQGFPDVAPGSSGGRRVLVSRSRLVHKRAVAGRATPRRRKVAYRDQKGRLFRLCSSAGTPRRTSPSTALTSINLVAELEWLSFGR